MNRSKQLDLLAAALEDILKDMYGVRMGFALFMFPFGEGDDRQAGDWVSNGQREDMIKFMRDVADRLEAGKDIPRTIGEA